VRIAVYHNQPSGGARRALYELGSRLAMDHVVDVYTLATADETFLSSRDFAHDVYVHPYSRRRPVRFGLYLNEVRQLLDLRDLQRASRDVAAEIDERRYDAVLVDACRFTQAPSVLSYLGTPHAYYCHEPPRRFLHKEARPDAAPLSLYERARHAWHAPARILYDRTVQETDQRNVRSAQALLTNSEHTSGLLRSYYGRDASVVRLGVDAQRFTPCTSASGDYVLSVGALEPHKGFDFLVRSVSRIPRRLRPPLVIAGNTDGAGVGADLRRLALSLDVNLRVVVNVTEQHLLSLYHGAAAFVYSPHKEPFGLVVLEAMACGLPVVAVAEGGPLESVIEGETGYLPPRDEDAFAEALARVLSDESLASDFSSAGREVVEREWTWEAAARRIEAHLVATAAAPAEALA
jgi:glycosyltransferase involved in cell wall biosynthesis